MNRVLAHADDMYMTCQMILQAHAAFTLLTASRKSFSVTVFLRARMAYIPASVHTLLMSAPVELGHSLHAIISHKVRPCSACNAFSSAKTFARVQECPNIEKHDGAC